MIFAPETHHRALGEIERESPMAAQRLKITEK
jgi:hypothetical protein